MLVAGITGGIGSGKTFIASIFQQLGVPVYNADKRANLLMTERKNIIAAIKELLGNESYDSNGDLNKKVISNAIFSDENIKRKVNAVVHPEVALDFDAWKTKHKDLPYIIKESAILFESGANKGVDAVICVTAPTDVRLLRVKRRDGITDEKILSIIKNQMTDKEREPLCNFWILNDGEKPLLPQIMEIHNHLISIKK